MLVEWCAVHVIVGLALANLIIYLHKVFSPKHLRWLANYFFDRSGPMWLLKLLFWLMDYDTKRTIVSEFSLKISMEENDAEKDNFRRTDRR